MSIRTEGRRDPARVPVRTVPAQTVPVRAPRPRGRGEDAPPRRGGGSNACRFRAGSACTPTGVASCRCDTSAACACSSRRKPIADALSRAAGDNERVGDYSRFLFDPPVRDKRLLELSLGDRAVWRACPDGGVSSCVRDYLGPAGTRRRTPAWSLPARFRTCWRGHWRTRAVRRCWAGSPR